MQCSNNFKQWGLALHVYHDACNSFPAGQSWNKGVTTNGYDWLSPYWSTTFALLPYMEQTARYAGLTSIVMDYQIQFWHTDYSGWYGARLLMDPIPTILCPSDDTRSPGVTGAARTSIMSCHGDTGDGNNYPIGETYSAYWGGPTMTPLPSGQGHRDVSRRGMFAPYTWKGMGAVVDGTSNTVAASETVNNPGVSGYLGIKGGVYGAPGSLSSAAICNTAARSLTNRTQLASGTASFRGNYFGDGRPVCGQFGTVMPPNAPSCTVGSADDNWAFSAASSNHTGGVNVLRVDGSVSFISDTIETNLTGQDGRTDGYDPSCGPQSGRSPYGIWGAMGSINGGESVSVP